MRIRNGQVDTLVIYAAYTCCPALKISTISRLRTYLLTVWVYYVILIMIELRTMPAEID